MLGGVLSLLSAAAFAFNNVSARRGVLTATVGQGMAISVPIGVPLLLLTAALTGSLGLVAEFSPRAIMWLSLAGIIHFVWGRYCNYRAVKAVGGNLAGTVQQTSLVLALGLAMWLLGETMTPLKVLGIILVLTGPAMTLRSRYRHLKAKKNAEKGGSAPAAKPGAFEPAYGEGFAFSLLGAVAYGISPILVRLGFASGGIGIGLAGSLVSYVAAGIVVVLLIVLVPGQLRHALSIAPVSAKWFTISGVFVCLSQTLRYMALAIAPVTVVQPIQQTSLIFRIIFGWFLNREHEVFDRWVVLGIAISLVGAIGLSLGTDIVLAYLPLPEGLAEIARWEWPARLP